MEIKEIIRENIWKLEPYSCARDEYSGDEAVFLDANENPYETGYNRYPDPYQKELKAKISILKKMEVENMVLGNGSDEIIDLLIRSICEPKVDNLIVFSPGYSMYEVSAAINQVEVRKINLTVEFLPDWNEMYNQIDKKTKMIFLCTPNNPTGKVIPFEQIERLCCGFAGIVVVDEAYIDFTDECSAVSLLKHYSNVVVMQTFSKAWGMAGLRLGICFADPLLVNILNKVKAPYNISSLTQKMVLKVLQQEAAFKEKCDMIKVERERLLKELRVLNLFTQVYDSDANFILVISEACREVYRYLVDRKLVVRLRDIPPVISGGIRITVGTRIENERLLEVLKSYKREKQN